MRKMNEREERREEEIDGKGKEGIEEEKGRGEQRRGRGEKRG